MKYAIRNAHSFYYNFYSRTFTDIENDCLLPSRSIAEYVLEPIGDYLIDPATLHAEKTPLDCALQIVDIDKMATSEGYAVLTSEGLFYHFETDMPGLGNEECLLPSRAIADNIVDVLHEGSFYYTSNQIQFASRYIKQTNDRLALFMIHVTP